MRIRARVKALEPSQQANTSGLIFLIFVVPEYHLNGITMEYGHPKYLLFNLPLYALFLLLPGGIRLLPLYLNSYF